MPYRVDWWIKRSASPEYQRAYNKISDAISLDSSEVLVDVGCGHGELLKRVSRGRLMGIDESIPMLKLARRNLASRSKASVIYSSFPGAETIQKAMTDHKVVLVRDSYLGSKIPTESVDQVVVAFPEVTFTSIRQVVLESTKTSSMSEFREKVERGGIVSSSILDSAGSQISSDSELNHITIVKTAERIRDVEIYRILKPNGLFTLADYDGLNVLEDSFEAQKSYMRTTHIDEIFDLLSSKLEPDRAIDRDATLGRERFAPELKFTGYSVSVMRKIKIC